MFCVVEGMCLGTLGQVRNDNNPVGTLFKVEKKK